MNLFALSVNTFALLYFATVGLLAVVLTVYDKSAAKKGKRRVKERTLLIISVLGGSAAMLLTMLAIRHKTRHMKFMLGTPLILALQIAAAVFAFDSRLEVSRHEVVTNKINGEITLALVADLHSCYYGGGQEELINAVEESQPDAVLLAGDIFDDVLHPENAERFIKDIAGKYPCFYVSGNHELWSGTADGFKEILESYGVTVLEGTSEILEADGGKIRIGGIDDPDTDSYPSRSVPYAEQLENLNGVSGGDVFTVLLSHRPERIDELLPLKPDLVLSGHAHGGQWRLPVLLENGLLSPDQGLFPKYTNGEYFFGECKMIVSRGLARESTIVIPRIFNRPEVVVVKLIETAQTAEYRKITAEQAKAIIDGGEDYILLDVRTVEEWTENRIEGALLIPDYEISERAEDELPDKSASILIYCRSGRRSADAANTLVDMGYINVYDFGGISDWPYETVSGSPTEPSENMAKALNISFNYTRQSGYASNQFAVWIEDMDGYLVKTLYATRYTAGGGYRDRPDSIPLWVEKSGLASLSEDEADEISGATPKAGTLSYVWDLSDNNGVAVSQGEYKVFIEGSLCWKNRVVYSAVVNTDGSISDFEAEYIYEETDGQPALDASSRENEMIKDVMAEWS